MVRYLKRGQDAGTVAATDAKIRATVEGILADVEARGDAAVRELSEKFDKWSPASFRLVRGRCRSRPCRQSRKQDLEDIRFAQAQVRNFAQQQRAAVRGHRGRDAAGRLSRPQEHPGRARSAATCRAANIRWSASAHMSVVTAKVAGVKRVIACAPPFHGGPHPAIVAAMHLGGADEIYVLGGVQAVAAMALGTETIAPVDMLVGPGNAFVAEAKRQLSGASASTFSRVRPKRSSSPTTRSTARSAPPIFWGRPSTASNSPAVLLTTSEKLARDTMAEVERQLAILPTAETGRQVLGRLWRGDRLRQR